MKSYFIDVFKTIEKYIMVIVNKTKNSKVYSKLHKFHQKRNLNSEKYKVTNALLLFFFPLFIVAISEINQMKSVNKFILFSASRPSIMLFNLILASFIFWVLVFLLKRGFFAITIMGITYFALSTVELFKFNTSGNHLILSDMRMAKGIKKLTSFAYIKITPMLVTCFCLLLIYICLAFWFNPSLKMKIFKRTMTAAVCAGSLAYALLAPSIAMPVYAFFDVDTAKADNVFKMNEKFDNNSFLAFFTETATENFGKKVEMPENYSADAIDTYLNEVPANEDIKNAEWEKPNVIVIMSEAFTDFRRFEELNIDDSYYQGFDEMAAEGFKGNAVVPTFASFTVRTEFELNFGLPVKSLGDPNMPQRLLLDRPQPTIAQYYHDMGYNTSYIHTFTRSFYSRGRVYANFGFDNMYFDDNLTVPVEYNGSYIDDETIFNQITKILKENNNQPTFIHTTTMQDHQPYDEEGKTEIEAYLDRVHDMTTDLKAFTQELKEIDRPTVVLFVGDHLPCFKGEGNIYEQLNMNGDNCNILYEQPYIVWSNYNMDYSKLSQDEVSVFYLPFTILDSIGAPKDSFVQSMLDKMKDLPIYTTAYDNTIPADNELDMYTYDRVFGDKLSSDTESSQIYDTIAP